MGDSIDLSGDGGVVKIIVRSAKSDAISPSESFSQVDGTLFRFCCCLIQFKLWTCILHLESSLFVSFYWLFPFVWIDQFVMKESLLKLVKSLILHMKIILFFPLRLERVLWSKLGILHWELWRWGINIHHTIKEFWISFLFDFESAFSFISSFEC